MLAALVADIVVGALAAGALGDEFGDLLGHDRQSGGLGAGLEARVCGGGVITFLIHFASCVLFKLLSLAPKFPLLLVTPSLNRSGTI